MEMKKTMDEWRAMPTVQSGHTGCTQPGLHLDHVEVYLVVLDPRDQQYYYVEFCPTLYRQEAMVPGVPVEVRLKLIWAEKGTGKYMVVKESAVYGLLMPNPMDEYQLPSPQG